MKRVNLSELLKHFGPNNIIFLARFKHFHVDEEKILPARMESANECYVYLVPYHIDFATTRFSLVYLQEMIDAGDFSVFVHAARI